MTSNGVNKMARKGNAKTVGEMAAYSRTFPRASMDRGARPVPPRYRIAENALAADPTISDMLWADYRASR